MNEKIDVVRMSQLDCCPELRRKPICDTLNLRYRLPFRGRVGKTDRQSVPVEVILHFRLERCSGPLVIGDPVYSTTLLPGEKVRLFTSDRHSRWSYDSETSLAYRHETTSEESYYTAGMAQAMSDLTVTQQGAASSSYEESWAEGGGGASFSFLGIIEVGGGGGGGSYDSHSAYSFAQSLSRHAESASRYVAASVRARSSTAVGEVEQRTHKEGESEAHYESSSRTFRNDNHCHAVTYLFYKLNKLQRVRFRLVAIERLVDDPSAPTGAYQRIPVDTTGRITVLPKSISAISKDRLEVEQVGRASVASRLEASQAASTLRIKAAASAPLYSISDRRAALHAVDKDLADAGVLNPKTGEPTERIIAELSWEREEVLPTPGILVKGCLDECNTCEDGRKREIALELEHKHLENEMLKRQIELLDKAQEYRCCPGVGEEEVEEP